MHLFLTGAKQVGKSTAIMKALAHTALTPGGFRTAWVHPQETLGLCPFSQVALTDAQVVAWRHDGHMQADVERFDVLGTATLAAGDEDIIVMDECGFLEQDALLFQKAVLNRLDGGIPVLGVVRQGAGGWTEQILNHPKVKMLQVTQENRDSSIGVILAWIEEETDGKHD
jgi:Predicted nucleotide kinase